MRILLPISLIFALWGAITPCHAQAVITTYAGTGTGGFSGDGGPATSARLAGGPGVSAAMGVAIDNAGNLLILDGGNNRVRRVDAAGIITTIAGGGSAIGNGDGGPATSAKIFANGIVVDAAGNLYLAETGSIRKVNAAGVITTIAGTGFPGFSGDGGPAISATFFCTNVAVDGAGNLYLADTLNQRIRKIDTSGKITTVAGNGKQGFSGDGGPATSAMLQLPQGLTSDTAGNLYFAEVGRVRKVDTAGIISTVAGNGNGVVSGDGGPATSAGMAPVWVTLDKSGNLYIADTGNRRIRKVNTSGIISTLAGGAQDVGLGNGDGGPATSAVLSFPGVVAVDPAGNVYIADSRDARVRKVSSGDSGSPVIANPASLSFSYTTGTPAPPAQTVTIISPGATLTFTATASTTLGGPWLAVTPTSGNVATVLSISVNPTTLAPGTYNGTITITPSGAGNTPQTVAVKLSVNAPVTQGVISTVAGNGFIPYSGEGAAATKTALNANAVAVDGAGNVYVAAMTDSRVLRIAPSGTVTTLAGNGALSFGGDGGPATRGAFFYPLGIAIDKSGNVFIADSTNNRIRKVDTSGTLTTVAGTGSTVFSGDGGPAVNAGLSGPYGIAIDGAGNLFIADGMNNRIRKVNSSGVITTVAGGAVLPIYSGDGGPAVGAGLFIPGGIAVDASGNLYISDMFNNRVRKVNAAGIISTVAGNGTKGFSGDGGPATSAQLNLPGTRAGLAVDSVGNLYIADGTNNRIRKVDTAGIITTIAGNGIAGFSGDGGPANVAGLKNPTDIAVDGAGNLYVADTGNYRVRKITLSTGQSSPAVSSSGVVNGASFQAGIVPNSWASILGSNLAAAEDTWANAIVNGKLPTIVGGVTVTIGGKDAYLSYVSPTQINLLAPDIPAGPTQVIVKTPSGTSSTLTVTASQYAPAFFVWPGSQAVATRPDYSFAVKAGSFPGATTGAAKPGDVIILWGTGFGPTSPAPPAGFQVPADRTYATASQVTVAIGNLQATVLGAALTPGFAGLYQVAIQLPATLGDGDWPVIATIGGASSPSDVVLSVRH